MSTRLPQHPSVLRKRERDVAALLHPHRVARCDRSFDLGELDVANYQCEHDDAEIAAEILAFLDADGEAE